MPPTAQTDLHLPETGTWSVDPVHTSVSFWARHMLAAKVRGRFNTFSGSVTVAEAPEDSSVSVEIDAGSVDTGTEMRDNHLRSADFFDVENHPTITFRSTRLERSGAETGKLHGDLTIRGTTRPVELDLELVGVSTGPDGKGRAGFSATTEVDRDDFGVSWNQVLDAGGFVVSKTVHIEIDAELVKD